ncbi:MAG: exodeoxyribonuclease VII large subunit [Bacteroidaceae bacterium]|nr:exodeoxyribonuclease VII large subunit [Bacteroidaceae bacterium]
MEPLSLYELNATIRGVLEDNLDGEYWVSGELSDAKAAHGGHFYGELVQRSDDGTDIIARARVVCWANQYRLVSASFQRATGESLRSGLKVLLQVRVAFHENYGLSLMIQDVDPSYTLGSVVQRRKDILQQLEADGILHDNQSLPLSPFCQRIAIISSETAAGYGDFCHQLLHNSYQLSFRLQLFPAVMQGEHVEESVAAALERIAGEAEQWDVVVIIRGGGASSDLSDFDSYVLATGVAQCPLPVFTGIGHERDETVLDFVAHSRFKTPTAVATFLIEHLLGTSTRLKTVYGALVQKCRDALGLAKARLDRYAMEFPLLYRTQHEQQKYRIALLEQKCRTGFRTSLERERSRLRETEQRIALLDPTLQLRRGFSMTLCDGRLVSSVASLRPGDRLVTRLSDGEVESVIS